MWDTHRSLTGGVGVCPEAGVKLELELELELESSAVQWPEPNLVSTYVACVGNKLFIRVCLLLCFQLLGHIIYFIVFSYFCFLLLCVLFLLPSARFSAVCCLSSAFCFPIFIKQQNIYLLCLKRDETKQNLIALCLLTNCIVRRLEPASMLPSLSLPPLSLAPLLCRVSIKMHSLCCERNDWESSSLSFRLFAKFCGNYICSSRIKISSF